MYDQRAANTGTSTPCPFAAAVCSRSRVSTRRVRTPRPSLRHHQLRFTPVPKRCPAAGRSERTAGQAMGPEPDVEEPHGSPGWLEDNGPAVADEQADEPHQSVALPEWATNPSGKEPGSWLSRLDSTILSNTLVCTGAAVAEPLVRCRPAATTPYTASPLCRAAGLGGE